MSASTYDELVQHVGHKIKCVQYGDAVNVAVECHTCHEVLLDFDKPDAFTPHVLYECEICDCFHPWTFDGDCRDDANRYGAPDDYATRHGVDELQIEVRSMEDRVTADTGPTADQLLVAEMKDLQTRILDFIARVDERFTMLPEWNSRDDSLGTLATGVGYLSCGGEDIGALESALGVNTESR